ncbi:MAG: hypothetical protein KatS3mg042_1408 [Rhodothermaceae bacterium]|nr:MAG: hypothetical protein KatS3mg042_1408 [Rhodothermaceae bacterium]
MAPRLVIHIGTHRTGTGALRRVFTARQEELRGAGVFYWSESLRYPLTLAAIEPRRQMRLDLERDRIEALMRRQPAETYLWISPCFAGSPATGYREAGPIAHNLRHVTRSFEVEILLYVRRQDLFIESLYARTIEDGKSWSFEAFGRAHDLEAYDWYRLAEAFAGHFGRERVRVRPWEPAQLAGGDVAGDVAAVLGLPGAPEAWRDGAERGSYRGEALEVARWCNRHFDGEERRLLRQLWGEVHAAAPFTLIGVMDADTRARLLKHYAASNERLARHYLGRPSGRLFGDERRPTPCALTAAGVARVVRDVAAYWRTRLPEPQRRGVLDPFLRKVARLVQPLCEAGSDGAATTVPRLADPSSPRPGTSPSGRCAGSR